MTLPLKLFIRDWRRSEFKLLALALLVAVSAVTAVGFFTDRVNRGMTLQASAMLAADLVIGSNNPIPSKFKLQATKLELEQSQTLGFRSVVLHQDQTQLVEVKAVDSHYPLRGEIRVRDHAGDMERIADNTPQSGNLWIEAKLLAALGLETGDNLSLGNKQFRVSQLISRDTGEMSNLFRLGPRVLLSLDDIPATGLVTTASRVRHQLLVAGDSRSVASYKTWAENNLTTGLRLQQISNSRSDLRNTLKRGEQFLSLAALAAVLVAGSALALASRRYVESQMDAAAIMRTLGATQRQVIKSYLLRLIMLGLSASLAGTLIGFGAQQVLAEMMTGWFEMQLPAPSALPLITGLGTGLVMLVGFTLPPVWCLGSTPPLRVLGRNMNSPALHQGKAGLYGLLAVAALLFWQAESSQLAGWIIAGSLGTLLIFFLTARGLIALLTPLRQRAGTIWRYGLSGLARNPGITTMQLMGFGLGMLALLLLTVVRGDLINAWQLSIPPGTPNQFLINIQPNEVEAVSKFLDKQGLEERGPYPMLRARLVEINDRKITSGDYQDDRAQRLVSREFNLSWATLPAKDNRILSGSWWQQSQQNEALFSVEHDLAKTLGIALGDQLTFNLAGTLINARVSSLRQVKWDSFQPNFFVIGTPGLLQNHPTNYITSLYLPTGSASVMADLVRHFPAVTVIDVSSIMSQIREIMDRASAAIEYVFLFTIIAGLLVIYAGIQTSREDRRQESAILRTLGLSRRRILQAAAVEFITLGLLAGILASTSATLIGWVIATRVFGFDYLFNPWLWIIAPLVGALGIGITGILASYPLTRQPPVEVLRGEVRG